MGVESGLGFTVTVTGLVEGTVMIVGVKVGKVGVIGWYVVSC